MNRAVRALLMFAVVVTAAPAFAAPTFPPLTGRVVDEANVIPADAEAALTAKLKALEQATTDQFVVATVKSLQGYDVQDYGYRLGRAWGIGQKGKNNGVILLVAPNERDVGFEVGYGLEGTLTDALTKVIIENAILPRFRANDIPGGIARGVDDTIQVLSGDAEEIQKLADKRPADSGFWSRLLPIFIVFFGAIFLIVLSSLLRSGRPRGLLGALFWSGMGSSGGSSWGGGGSSWSGGGGGGGFSGGGGSFGGGGSSGHW